VGYCIEEEEEERGWRGEEQRSALVTVGECQI